MRQTDEGFVYGSWLGSLADECGVNRDDDHEFRAFKRKMRAGLERIISAKGTRTLVAHAKRDENVLMGWACGEMPSTLHFVYVAKPWRGGGVARALVHDQALSGASKATHFTSWGFPRVARMFTDLQFDPTLLIAER